MTMVRQVRQPVRKIAAGDQRLTDLAELVKMPTVRMVAGL